MTREQIDGERRALLAEMIRAGCDLSPAGSLERSVVRKIPHFLKKRGVPLDYFFDLYHYGAASCLPDIYADLDALVAEGAIREESDGPKRRLYLPDGEMDALLERFEAAIAPHRAAIADVLDVIAPFDDRRLQLLADLDWMHGMLRMDLPPEERDRSDFGARVVSGVVARAAEKRSRMKFPREELERTYWAMDGKGLLR